jgi:RES domain-containing protein
VLPRTTTVHQDDTHRLIPTRYLPGDVSVLSRLAGSARDLDDLAELEGATNERLIGEANRLPGISVHELVFGVPNFHIVNASFTHAAPQGSRFNGSDRGAWYAGFALQTAQTEVAFHFAVELREIPSWREPESRTYCDYLSDFRADFHDLRGNADHAAALDPASYSASQELARTLLNQGSAGVVYPSVRHAGGTCLACFRPALVTNVRQGELVTITLADASSAPSGTVAPS